MKSVLDSLFDPRIRIGFIALEILYSGLKVILFRTHSHIQCSDDDSFRRHGTTIYGDGW